MYVMAGSFSRVTFTNSRPTRPTDRLTKKIRYTPAYIGIMGLIYVVV